MGLVDKHGFGLTGLGWARESLETEDRSAVDGYQIAETLRREQGIDCRAKYRRQWTLPPSSAAGVAANVLAVLCVVDDRPPETARYSIRLESNNDFGPLAAT